MTPKKIHVLTRYVEILDAETQLTRALICINPHEKSTEYTDLSQVWHDASQEAEKNRLLFVEENNHLFTDCMRIDEDEDWSEFVRLIGINRWAYVDELLPKGGEL